MMGLYDLHFFAAAIAGVFIGILLSNIIIVLQNKK